MHNRGNILFTSLLVMIAMNLLVVALMQISLKENKQANLETTESTNLNITDTCVEETIDWLKSLTAPPTTLPYTITKSNLSHLYNGSEDTESLNQLSKYSYNCTVSALSIKSVEGQTTGTGENVVTKDSYGTSGDLSPNYYYQIVATSTNNNTYSKTTTTLVSVEF